MFTVKDTNGTDFARECGVTCHTREQAEYLREELRANDPWTSLHIVQLLPSAAHGRRVNIRKERLRRYIAGKMAR